MTTTHYSRFAASNGAVCGFGPSRELAIADLESRRPTEGFEDETQHEVWASHDDLWFDRERQAVHTASDQLPEHVEFVARQPGALPDQPTWPVLMVDEDGNLTAYPDAASCWKDNFQCDFGPLSAGPATLVDLQVAILDAGIDAWVYRSPVDFQLMTRELRDQHRMSGSGAFGGNASLYSSGSPDAGSYGVLVYDPELISMGQLAPWRALHYSAPGEVRQWQDCTTAEQALKSLTCVGFTFKLDQ